jgi:hypothetical protein
LLFNPIRYNHDFNLSNLDNIFRNEEEEEGDGNEMRKRLIPIKKIQINISQINGNGVIKGEDLILHCSHIEPNSNLGIDPMKSITQHCHLCTKK